MLIGFTALLAWISHIANTGADNFILDTINSIPNGDKIGHFFVMGAFAFLVNLLLACKSIRIAGQNILKGSLIVSFCVIIEEITQIFIETRTFSYFDLLSDFLGIVAFSLLVVKCYPTVSGWLSRTDQQFREMLGNSSTN